MPKLEYKPIAVQDECFGGRIGTDSPELTILIKLMAEGKTVHYKTDAQTFPNAEELDNWIKKTKVKILPEVDFKLMR